MTSGAPSDGRNIVLVGFMGAGKTEVGRRLATVTGRSFIDTDELVVKNNGSFDDIFASEGVTGFRRYEKRVVSGLKSARNAVIATGGGTVLDPSNVKTLRRSGVVVFLKASAEELARRLDGAQDRPLLRTADGVSIRERIDALLGERTPIYESVADHVIGCDGRKPRQIAEEIAERVGRAATRPRGASRKASASVRRVRVATQPAYNVYVGQGLLGRARELVTPPRAAEKARIVSHPRIKRLWGGALEASLRKAGLDVSWSVFPEGEDRKTVDTAAKISRDLARSGFHRGDVLFALGGGVVGDVTGYTASTFNRGIAYVQVPTTLLAMVDSSIGGKTGVNLPEGKNLVGTFHQPLAVIADLDVLGTLSERELRGGLAEVVKYGFIADAPLLALVRRQTDEIFARGEVLAGLISRCARTKARVVATDERDEGLRAIFNYGHTLGHAIESLAVEADGRSAKLHHGEAIAIGMMFAAAVSEALGLGPADLVAAHSRTLEAVGLPTTISGAGLEMRWTAVRKRMLTDKKYARGLRFVLLEGIGRPVVRPVPDAVLARAFEVVA